jgi:hypothetical protein
LVSWWWSIGADGCGLLPSIHLSCIDVFLGAATLSLLLDMCSSSTRNTTVHVQQPIRFIYFSLLLVHSQRAPEGLFSFLYRWNGQCEKCLLVSLWQIGNGIFYFFVCLTPFPSLSILIFSFPFSNWFSNSYFFFTLLYIPGVFFCLLLNSFHRKK